MENFKASLKNLSKNKIHLILIGLAAIIFATVLIYAYFDFLGTKISFLIEEATVKQILDNPPKYEEKKVLIKDVSSYGFYGMSPCGNILKDKIELEFDEAIDVGLSYELKDDSVSDKGICVYKSLTLSPYLSKIDIKATVKVIDRYPYLTNVKILTSSAEKNRPYCGAIGSRSEGWYIDSGFNRPELIRWEKCKGCVAICKAIGSRSEGWYSSCDNRLIKWDNCGKKSCYSDKDCRRIKIPVGKEVWMMETTFDIAPMMIQSLEDGHHARVEKINDSELKITVDGKEIEAIKKYEWVKKITKRSSQFCEFPEGTCKGPGKCTEKSEICAMIYAPVCGCDNKTYSNDCTRQSAGVSKKHNGKCGEEGQTCDEKCKSLNYKSGICRMSCETWNNEVDMGHTSDCNPPCPPGMACPAVMYSCCCQEKISEDCAKEGERVNRNPFFGSTDKQCCSGLIENRVSFSYSICEKPEDCVKEGEFAPVFPGALECCEGLTRIGCEEPDSNNICPTERCGGAAICANCGNGICGLGENKCNCPEDCKEGMKKCTDTDHGRDYYTKGTVTFKTISVSGQPVTVDLTDLCELSPIPPRAGRDFKPKLMLHEYYCDENGVRVNGVEQYFCPNGCEDGACVKGNEPYCANIGTRSEGWIGTGISDIKYENCDGCYAICMYPETDSEGWYSSGSCETAGKLIKYGNCALQIDCAKEGEVPTDFDFTTGQVNPNGKKCCEGLKAIGPKTSEEVLNQGICAHVAGGPGVCRPCGDEICDSEFEDYCNCPEDCKEGERLSADLNNDGRVGAADFGILLSCWGKNPNEITSCKNTDIDKDRIIGAADFGIMLSQWTTDQKIIDCGEDYDCLYQQISNGNSAKIIVTEEIVSLSLIEKSEVKVELINNKYQVSMKVLDLKEIKKEKFSVRSIVGSISKTCPQIINNLDKVESKSATCIVDSAKEAKQLAIDGLTESAIKNYNCKGCLIDAINEICVTPDFPNFPPGVRKPAVYLYPEEKLEIEVNLSINGFITKSEPDYLLGWKVAAEPDGLIDNEYDYLFYEAQLNNIELPNEGWVVEYSNLENWFDKNLPQLGLNQKEIFQFKEYWIGELEESNYYEIKLLDEVFLTENMNLIINPQPDTTIRRNFYFKPLNEKVVLAEPTISTPERIGFTAVEWGGLLDK